MTPRRTAARLAALLILALLLTAAGAEAQQQQGFAVDRFDPSERGSDWFALDSLDLRGNLRPALGVVGDFAYRPLVFYKTDGTLGASLVRNQYFLHPGGSLVLWDRLRVGLSFPVAIFEDHGPAAGQITVNGVTYHGPSGADAGDLRLTADVRLLGAYGEPFTFAFGAELFLPTGSRSEYTGDGYVRVEPRVIAAGQVGLFVYSARAGVLYTPLTDFFSGSQLGSQLLFAAAAGVKLPTEQVQVVFGPEIYGSTVLTGSGGPFQTQNTPFELIFGGHLTLARDWRVGAGVGPGLGRGDGTPEVRVLGSIEWAPAYKKPDRDHDGIPDVEDACPDVPGVRTDDPKTNGCPPPKPADRDGDGIPDAEDACPDVPGVHTADPKTNGCPPDRDHDGIYDRDDACPDEPGIHTDDQATNGCPDRDNDSVPDKVDACPDVPGVKTSDPATNGCPPDRDKDGIPDPVDACPDNPGPPNPDPTKNGCPLAVVQKGQIRIMEQIKFRFGSAELDPASDPVLQAVREILAGHAEIVHVRIEGHTDNKGSAAYNLNLSKKRAKSVLTWLVKHGVEAKRLESEGYGLTKPIADNATEEGRRDNRRVEFHIVGGTADSAEEKN